MNKVAVTMRSPKGRGWTHAGTVPVEPEGTAEVFDHQNGLRALSSVINSTEGGLQYHVSFSVLGKYRAEDGDSAFGLAAFGMGGAEELSSPNTRYVRSFFAPVPASERREVEG